jgi:hypothetical protein
MPVQLTLRSPKGGRVLAEHTYDDGRRIDAAGGWLAVVDRGGSVIALHAATPGLEGSVVECASAAAPYPAGETATYPTDDGIALDEGQDDTGSEHATNRHEMCEEQVLALRAEVDRLSELDELRTTLDLHQRRYGPTPHRSDRRPDRSGPQSSRWVADAQDRHHFYDDTPPQEPTGAEQHVYREDVEESAARAEREHAARLKVERLLSVERDARDREQAALRDCRDLAQFRLDEWNTTREERDALSRENTVLREQLQARTDRQQRAEAQLASIPGERHHFHDDTVPHEPIDLRPLDEDPRRPSLDAWPDDAVLLTYAELRRLVSLHLERYNADAGTARAVLEGDVPLRVSEVLDR